MKFFTLLFVPFLASHALAAHNSLVRCDFKDERMFSSEVTLFERDGNFRIDERMIFPLKNNPGKFVSNFIFYKEKKISFSHKKFPFGVYEGMGGSNNIYEDIPADQIPLAAPSKIQLSIAEAKILSETFHDGTRYATYKVGGTLIRWVGEELNIHPVANCDAYIWEKI